MLARKLSIGLIFILLVFTVNLAGSVEPENDDIRVFYRLDYGGVLVEVEAPAIAWPGDEFNITLRVQASARIHIDSVNLNISSLKENREEVPLIGTMAFLKDAELDPGTLNETRVEIEVPSDALPGLIYGVIWYSWHIKGSVPDPHTMLPSAFPATFIENKPYIELKDDFDALNSSHTSLQANFTSLEANYTELQRDFQDLESAQIGESNATGLMYLFLITTAIFVGTTLVLLTRRPKAATW